MDTNCIKAWAIARSLHKGANALGLKFTKENCIKPVLLNDKLISFGTSKGLVFTKQNLIILHSKGFAFPELRFLLSSPLYAFRKILTVKKIGYSLKSTKEDKRFLTLLLGVGLEATSVYMNQNQLCSGIMGNDTGLVEFYLNGDERPIASLDKENGGKWRVVLNQPMKNPRVRITFKDIDIGIQSCLGQLNPQVSSSLGKYTIDGYLPLMDKIGYCARITGNELPILIK
ncbi:hypothetical protein N9H45_05580 [Opitutales bacterium]|nr:hypothetical protein [Opitutales bacterium]